MEALEERPSTSSTASKVVTPRTRPWDKYCDALHAGKRDRPCDRHLPVHAQRQRPRSGALHIHECGDGVGRPGVERPVGTHSEHPPAAEVELRRGFGEKGAILTVHAHHAALCPRLGTAQVEEKAPLVDLAGLEIERHLTHERRLFAWAGEPRPQVDRKERVAGHLRLNESHSWPGRSVRGNAWRRVIRTTGPRTLTGYSPLMTPPSGPLP